MSFQRATTLWVFALLSCASLQAAASQLKIVPGEDCSAREMELCASHGASCGVIHDKNANATAVCRWPGATSANACKTTSGIWTAATSKYAGNHPDAVEPGVDGACITEVRNLKVKKAPSRTEREQPTRRTDHRQAGNRTDHRQSENRTDHRNGSVGLAAPSDLLAIDVSSNALTLVWTDNSDREYGVELYRIDPVAARNGSGADWEFVGLFEERSDSNVKGTGSRSDSDFDLTPDTNYCYRMRAYSGFDRSNVSSYSNAVCAKTLTTGVSQNDT